MADRQDPSQYAFTAGPMDGIAALPSTDITNDQLQRSPDADYAEGPEMLEMVSAPDFGDVPDLIHEKPGRFYTQGPRQTRDVGRPRLISPFGGLLAPGDGLLAGFNVRETSGTTSALVKFHDGYDANAPLIGVASLAPNESVRDWYLPGSIPYRYGLYVNIVTGAVEGLLYTLDTEDVI